MLPGSGMLHYDVGAGDVAVALSSVGGGVFEGALPAVACGTPVYYFTAQTADGITVSKPGDAPLDTFAAIAATGLGARL